MTKQERHKIYKRALDDHLVDKIQKIENDWPLVGLCHIFTIIGVDPNDLPEFLVHRPEDKTLKEHWWPTDSRDPNREEVLRDCIEKTKPL